MKGLHLVMTSLWLRRWLDLRRSGTPHLLFDHILFIHRINGGQKTKIVGSVPGHERAYSRQTARVKDVPVSRCLTNRAYAPKIHHRSQGSRQMISRRFREAHGLCMK